MVHDADGNLHYLNQHLEQLDKDERNQLGGGGSTIEEITGEELYDLIGGDDFSDILTELELNKRAYPNLDFDEALHLVQRYLEHKEKVSRDEYVMFLSKKVFEGLEHWLDTKWLAINSSPDKFLERLAEGISDIVYESLIDQFQYPRSRAVDKISVMGYIKHSSAVVVERLLQYLF